MKCKYFGKCGSCTLYNLSYEKQLHKKLSYIKDEFSFVYTKEFDIFSSEDKHFRNRAEFRVWHDGEEISYAMNGFLKKEIVKIDVCNIVEMGIYENMQKILDYIKDNPILKEKLFSIEFLNGEELLVSLIYHKKIDESWMKEAKKLEDSLGIFIIGRSRGVKLSLQRDYIFQKLTVEGKTYRYKVYENSFLQPNTKVNEKMIGWVRENSKHFESDLLELYCGHGNFTIPLSANFRKVLATEISKKSIKSAKENCELNSVSNIIFTRLSTEELVDALSKKRIFRRLEGVDIDSYDFSTVFVDPPRAGVDDESLKFISGFQNIIYISCNPKTLKRDIKTLSKSHTIKKFALFDQFAYTDHLECGVILKRRP